LDKFISVLGASLRIIMVLRWNKRAALNVDELCSNFYELAAISY